MTISKNVILLLKAQKSEEIEDKYETILNKNGFKVIQLKTIDFNFINLNEIKEKLDNPDKYQGIIFSSPRCVYAVEQALNGLLLNSKWEEKTNYVVGESTYKTVSDILGLKCKGKDSGNGNNLSEIIISEHSIDSKPFLMPCSSLKTDTIQNRLQQHQIIVDAVTAYDTVPNPNLPMEIANVTDNFKELPEIIVFFSPSGVKAFQNCLSEIQNEVNSIKFLSIGPTTSRAMEEIELTIHAVAEKPNPKELLKAILK